MIEMLVLFLVICFVAFVWVYIEKRNAKKAKHAH